uniref:Cobalamin biosynthesis protein CobD n=1 Tax=Candidatus Kentrum sp. MB TaxID=2138164 RepID=A0A451B948_9GAMM|nr:MAG: adenosylcobinamide-phosphate synthase [Candidatus Kentron sp. MB]VFK29345.1 MAG: adenosylcobinamide-phosphate synthase [Candidatus Kentron sp. MB]VFK74757.1 MAG: adenosylcobinamide-phosphate synthase [Candidatus Kentron sp. MB]
MIPPDLTLVIVAYVADALFGDPAYPFHPIRLLGSMSLFWERWLFHIRLNGYGGGVLHGTLVIGGALAAYWGIRTGLHWLHPWAAWGWDVFLAYSLLCTRDLLRHGRQVLEALDDLPTARQRVALLVGRDTAELPREGITRATIESLAENLTDGVLTPLWALCLFGLPGLVVVKAISSLDSMVGYKTPRYRRFGWFAARSDDLIHWLPARLSAPLIMVGAALLGLHPRLAWRAARRYHAMLASPNSGWSEAACAGALRVRLMGPIRYSGKLANHAFMGDDDWPQPDAADLRRALRLITICSLLALLCGIVGLWLQH